MIDNLLFLVLAYISVVTIDRMHHQYTINKFGVETQLTLKFIFSAMILFIFSFFFFDFFLNFSTFLAPLFLFIYISLYIFSITYTNKLIATIDIFLFVLLLKLQTPINYFIDLLIGNVIFSFLILIGIAMLVLGNVMLVDDNKKKRKIDRDVSFIMLFVVLIAWVSKSYIIFFGLNNNYYNVELLSFVSALSLGVFALFKYKKKIIFNKASVLNYLGQGFTQSVYYLLYLKIMGISVFYTSVIEAIVSVIIAILSPFVFGSNISKKDVLAIIIVLIGFLLINYYY